MLIVEDTEYIFWTQEVNIKSIMSSINAELTSQTGLQSKEKQDAPFALYTINLYTGCAKKKKDILNIHIKSEGIIIFSQKFY